MKLGEVCLIGNVVQINFFGKVIVNEKFCLNNSSIEINSWIFRL